MGWMSKEKKNPILKKSQNWNKGKYFFEKKLGKACLDTFSIKIWSAFRNLACNSSKSKSERKNEIKESKKQEKPQGP